jgi:hypothetical protein
VAPLGFLLGRWCGDGTGGYPTVEPFGYREESVYWHVGTPFIGYRQQTWRSDGRPSHSEAGYWRCPGEGRVELVLGHANGIVEVSEGQFVSEGDCEGAAITMTSSVMARTSTAKDVSAITRRIAVEAGVLDQTLEMAAVGIPMTFHLRARLRREETGEAG